MPFATESVTLPGSGLTFINSYDDSVSAPYRSAILQAENDLQSHFTNPVTISVDFTLASLDPGSAASNRFGTIAVSYDQLAGALRAHAASADDLIAVNGLPATDPSNGAGFAIAVPEAVILGLFPQTNAIALTVTLNANLPWTFGQDAVGALEHELSEGGFGRFASLGVADAKWQPLDLFRFTAAGVRDYTGGSDGAATFFGLDATHVSGLRYHDAVNAAGVFDGADLGDWQGTFGDAFGPGGPSAPGSMSPTDLQVLDILGWNTAPFTPAPDDFADSRTDGAHPMGQIAVGGALHAALQQAGDRDWFAVELQAGHAYAIAETGHDGGGGTLADPYLRLHDSTGAEVAFDDDIVSGTSPDASLTFTPAASGTYYIEAGAFVDGYAGSYRVSVADEGAVSPPPPPPNLPSDGDDVLRAGAGDTSIDGGAGNDTISGWSGGDVLRGGDGDDSVLGGSGFDDINGNKGADTLDGGAGGADWLVGGQGNDLITAHAGGNILYGNLGNDTLDGGSGAEILRGGQGDDVIAGGAGDDWISGDRGADTLTGGAGADTFHSFAGAGYDLVTDFHAAEGDRVMLDPGTSYHLIQAGADLVIDMGDGEEMVLRNVQLATLPPGWIFGA
jgi:Ca2+-binding RTX toxin-like protein